MDYSVGSLADFISGSDTPNKPKVVEKIVKKSKKSIDKSDNSFDKSYQETVPQQNESSPPKSNKKRKNDKQVTPHKKSKPEENESLTEGTPEITQDAEAITSHKKEPPKDRIVSNAERRIKHKIKEEKQKNNSIHDERTLFIGNVPISINKIKLKKLCEKYGKVDSVRLRCPPLADPRTPKKVAIIKKEFHPERTSLHSYVRFVTKEDALKALQLNGHKFKDNHLRVNLCSEPEKPDENKAIFVGNVSFDAEEDDLWNLFESCGDIESVRLIRDRNTNIGKGFGYVNFKSSDAVQLALEMENIMLKNRELRVSACDSSKKSKRKEKKNRRMKDNEESFKKNKKIMPEVQQGETVAENDAVKDADGDDAPKKKKVKKAKLATNGAESSKFQGEKFTDKKKKKKFNKGAQQKKKMIKKIAPK